MPLLGRKFTIELADRECVCILLYIHVLMRDEKEGRKKQAKSNKQLKAKQHSTPKAVTFPHVYTCTCTCK